MNPRSKNRNLSSAVGVAPANGQSLLLAMLSFVIWTPAWVSPKYLYHVQITSKNKSRKPTQ